MDAQVRTSTTERSGTDEIGALPRTRTTTRWQRLWRPFWVLPMVIVFAATTAGIVLPELDRSLAGSVPYVFGGGPDGARSVLGTIAGAMISVTGLVFSITMVVLQLASSQYTPRVLRDFLGNRVSQATLGIFAASFAYALTVLRSVRGESDGEAFVPQVSVTVAFLLVLTSVAMFLAFIHHITQSIQVATIVSNLGDMTVDVIRRTLPESSAPGARLGTVDWQPNERLVAQTITAEEHGAVAEIDHRRLVDLAAEQGVIVEVLPQVGDFVPEGQDAVRVWRVEDSSPLDEAAIAAIRRAILVEQDRYFTQDPSLGIRKLVDIGERALSPGINDPTTAVQVVDELHRILRVTVERAELPALVSRDGLLRLVHRPQRVEQLVDLALAETLHYGAGSLQVPRRILLVLDDLLPTALPEHRPVLERWLLRVEQIVAEQRD